MTSPFANMAFARIQTASSIHATAHYMELQSKDNPAFAMIAQVLYKEAEKVSRLGLQEISILHKE